MRKLWKRELCPLLSGLLGQSQKDYLAILKAYGWLLMWLGFKGLSSLEQHESSDGFSIMKVAGCDLNTKSISIIIIVIIIIIIIILFIYLFIYLHIHSLLFSDRSWVMNPSSSTFFSHKLLFSCPSFHKKRVTTFHIHCAFFF